MKIKISNRSVYAPIRYEATRPYAASIGRTYAAHARQGDMERSTFLSNLLPRLKAATKHLGPAEGPGPLQAEIMNVQIFGRYLDAGKVIYDIASPLASALLVTDANDIPCDELPFPCNAFYIHFGQWSGLKSDGWEIEGAFVDRFGDKMVIDLVPRNWGRPYFMTMAEGESTVGVSIDLQDGGKPIQTALADSIKAIVRNNEQMMIDRAQIEAQLTARYGECIRIDLPSENLAAHEPLLRKATALIVNVMFYLAAEPEDVVSDWGADVPAEALDALHRARAPGGIRTIENTLRNAGYNKIHFVGRNFSSSVASRETHDAISTGRTIATHFRRGHFRRQPYGPENSLRKTIFIAPVLVNPSIGAESAPGRIYTIG